MTVATDSFSAPSLCDPSPSRHRDHHALFFLFYGLILRSLQHTEPMSSRLLRNKKSKPSFPLQISRFICSLHYSTSTSPMLFWLFGASQFSILDRRCWARSSDREDPLGRISFSSLQISGGDLLFRSSHIRSLIFCRSLELLGVPRAMDFFDRGKAVVF